MSLHPYANQHIALFSNLKIGQEVVAHLPVCAAHLFKFRHCRYLLLYRMNDLEFFGLGIYEFEQQLINCVGKPSRCNKPGSAGYSGSQ